MLFGPQKAAAPVRRGAIIIQKNDARACIYEKKVVPLHNFSTLPFPTPLLTLRFCLFFHSGLNGWAVVGVSQGTRRTNKGLTYIQLISNA